MVEIQHGFLMSAKHGFLSAYKFRFNEFYKTWLKASFFFLPHLAVIWAV